MSSEAATHADDPATARAEVTAWLHRVAQGDRAALEALYHRTSAKLFGVCLRILGDRAEAEDVLQEVYVTVWHKAGQFDAARGTSPITWLAIMARNRALDRLRAQPRRLASLDEALQLPDPAPPADSAMAARQAAQQLADCLAQLDERAAAAIRAAFFGGQTYDNLARLAGMPLGSMKSLIRRGLMRLKHCLEP